MNILIMAEYVHKEGKFHIADEAQGYINHLSKNHRVFVHTLYDTKDKVLDVKNNKLDKIYNIPISALFLGVQGKMIWKYNLNHSFSESIKRFYDRAEFLMTQFPSSSFINPMETIISNTSKRYIMELQNKLPFIHSEIVTGIDHLLELHQNSDLILTKPLISERSRGAVVLQDLTKEQVIKYGTKYLSKPKVLNSLYDRVIANQGIMAQEYSDAFKLTGEKKVGVIQGKPTLSRINLPMSDGRIVKYSPEGTTRYSLNEKEHDLVKRAYHEFTQIFPASYLRVDITGKDPIINEIEAINPDYATMDPFFSPLEKWKHFRALEQSLEEKVLKRSIAVSQ